MPQAGTATRELEPGARVGGRYALVRALASGGMGDVWLATNEGTGASVALKILRPAADERTRAEERFRREARLGGLLAHRSIVRIYDLLDEPGGELVLVMELLRGETLEQLLARRGALSTREALAVGVAVLSALQHGHEQGIVHRDVKPANVFLAVEPDGRVLPKLLDYGIAKMPASDPKTIDGLVLGTPSYMSPEQIRAEGEVDGRSDLFSVAVCLFEMLTAECPFQAATPAAAIAAVLEHAVDPDPRVEPRLWLELRRALSKRPAERHASAAEMSAALCAAAGETPESLSRALDGAVIANHEPFVPPSRAEGVASPSVVRVKRGASRAKWLLVAAAAAVLTFAVTMWALTPPAAPRPPTAVTAPSATPSAAPSSAAADPPIATPPEVATAASSAPPRDPAAPSSPRPHRPHPRPIATSPGF